MHAKLNEIRGLADAIAEVQVDYGPEWNQEKENNIRYTCDKVLDSRGFMNEDSIPYESEFKEFNEWMQTLITNASYNWSMLKYLDLSITVYDLDIRYYIDFSELIHGYTQRLTVYEKIIDTDGSINPNMTFNFKIDIPGWIHMYKLIKKIYTKNDGSATHHLVQIVDEIAHEIEVAMPQFTVEFFKSIPL